jgi:hypothetical protein
MKSVTPAAAAAPPMRKLVTASWPWVCAELSRSSIFDLFPTVHFGEQRSSASFLFECDEMAKKVPAASPTTAPPIAT